jgi:phosphohistidine phosphatase
MELVVVRHGIAMDRDMALEQAMADKDRPLTAKGRSRMKRIAKGMRRAVPNLISIFSSPLLRAVETAEIVATEYGDAPCARTPALLPEADPDELVPVLAGETGNAPLAVVGHEPHLSRFVTWCLAGDRSPLVELKKGGSCLLRFDGAPARGSGRLIWLAPPAILRHI